MHTIRAEKRHLTVVLSQCEWNIAEHLPDPNLLAIDAISQYLHMNFYTYCYSTDTNILFLATATPVVSKEENTLFVAGN